MFLLINLLVICAAGLLSLSLIPMFTERLRVWQSKKEESVARELDSLFHDRDPKQIVRLYIICPFVFGLFGLLIFRSPLFLALGGVLGLFIPNFILKIKESQRRQRLQSQILDAIMVLSTSLKGGLSLLQAFEALEEEISPPMSQEIGLVIREVKMGVPLEESLKHFDQRVNSEEFRLIVNSILIARETGGDLTKVLSRLSTTVRDSHKLKDSIRTLTLQGRIQGVIMSFLPIVFTWWVLTFNKSHFDIMLHSERGRMLLLVAVFLQIVGMILIKKFSTIKI